jgi:hypothetical protein
MKSSPLVASASTAALFALSLSVSAQTSGRPSGQDASAQGSQKPVTLTGCVQTEAEYRQAKNLGKGGAASTGVGVGNEYVIVGASLREKAGEAPTGTAGISGDAYEVTGSAESELKQHAGKRVEITGRIKPVETAAGKPTGGIDPMRQDLKLPELEVATVRATTGDCPER